MFPISSRGYLVTSSPPFARQGSQNAREESQRGETVGVDQEDVGASAREQNKIAREDEIHAGKSERGIVSEADVKAVARGEPLQQERKGASYD
jgi:hypothetical protein